VDWSLLHALNGVPLPPWRDRGPLARRQGLAWRTWATGATAGGLTPGIAVVRSGSGVPSRSPRRSSPSITLLANLSA